MLENAIRRHQEYLNFSEDDLPLLKVLHGRGWLDIGCVQPTISQEGVTGSYSQEFIDHARAWIVSQVRDPCDIASIGCLVQAKFLGVDYGLSFKWGARLVASLGKCKGTTISVTSTLADRSYPCYILGIIVRSAVAAVCVVIEHELVHYLVNKIDPLGKPHGVLFRSVARSLFGHTETSHEIVMPCCAEPLRVGQRVSFPLRASVAEGVILKVNKKTADIATDSGDEKRVYLQLLTGL